VWSRKGEYLRTVTYKKETAQIVVARDEYESSNRIKDKLDAY